jgi:hypothetical protein
MWVSGTRLLKQISVTKEQMINAFGELDRYNWEEESNFNWCFISNTNENAKYNVYTHDGGETIKLGINDIWEDSYTFKKWLEEQF